MRRTCGAGGDECYGRAGAVPVTPFAAHLLEDEPRTGRASVALRTRGPASRAVLLRRQHRVLPLWHHGSRAVRHPRRARRARTRHRREWRSSRRRPALPARAPRGRRRAPVPDARPRWSMPRLRGAPPRLPHLLLRSRPGAGPSPAGRGEPHRARHRRSRPALLTGRSPRASAHPRAVRALRSLTRSGVRSLSARRTPRTSPPRGGARSMPRRPARVWPPRRAGGPRPRRTRGTGTGACPHEEGRGRCSGCS